MSFEKSLNDFVDRRRDGEVVDPTTVDLCHPSGSLVKVRPAGGFVESLTLVNGRGKKHVPHDLFYTDGLLEDSRRSASHIMSPAGPYEGIGRQHGPGRWLDWHVFNLKKSKLGNPQIALQAKREDSGETLLRHIELMERQAWFESAVVAPENESYKGSLGEHWYFKTLDELESVRINGKTLELLSGDCDAFEKVRSGLPLHIKQESTSGTWGIRLPGQPMFEMSTRLTGGEGFTPSELWIWRRDDASGYLCIEPVVGVSHENGYLENDLLIIEAGKSAHLRTSFSLAA